MEAIAIKNQTDMAYEWLTANGTSPFNLGVDF